MSTDIHKKTEERRLFASLYLAIKNPKAYAEESVPNIKNAYTGSPHA